MRLILTEKDSFLFRWQQFNKKGAPKEKHLEARVGGRFNRPALSDHSENWVVLSPPGQIIK
jgi:hypothetical protein